METSINVFDILRYILYICIWVDLNTIQLILWYVNNYLNETWLNIVDRKDKSYLEF